MSKNLGKISFSGQTAQKKVNRVTERVEVGHPFLRGSHIVLPQENDPVTPTLAFGDGDSGLYEVIDDQLSVAIAGTARWFLGASVMGQYAGTGGGILTGAASATVPSLCPVHADINTGIGAVAADQLSLIAGGVEAIRCMTTFVSFYSSEGGAAIMTEVATATNPVFVFYGDADTGIGRAAVDQLSLIAGGVEILRLYSTGALTIPSTITAPGTTGNQTINKPAGRVNIAAAGTTVTVTNSLVTANSIVLVVAATADTTAQVTSVVSAAGSFVINTVAVTAETAFNFLVIS